MLTRWRRAVRAGSIVAGCVLTLPTPGTMPQAWKPVTYAHRAPGRGVASLRASSALRISDAHPHRVTVRGIWQYAPDTDSWQPLPMSDLPSVLLPVPPPQRLYSAETDRVLFVIPAPVGLFWAKWEEDGRPATSFVYAGPVLCNDVALGSAPPGRVAACVPFPDRAEARFVPDPSSL